MEYVKLELNSYEKLKIENSEHKKEILKLLEIHSDEINNKNKEIQKLKDVVTKAVRGDEFDIIQFDHCTTRSDIFYNETLTMTMYTKDEQLILMNKEIRSLSEEINHLKNWWKFWK